MNVVSLFIIDDHAVAPFGYILIFMVTAYARQKDDDEYIYSAVAPNVLLTVS